ncbi:TnsA endonuclease N-terminal domain-containing protein [Desulfosporosinus fructosivorans]|nr:TnsA endonuclease N-terminal domain-containing protein [Desulfosporosinus fructosivorans]
MEREILTILENSQKVVFFNVQPFKIPYYYFKQRNYIPDIFFVLEDGRGAVIEVKPRFHMVLELNLQKYNNLKRYCEENGYGILVTDGGTSMKEFITYEYNKVFEEELFQRLKKGPILWRGLSILKTKHIIGYRDIASIVAKNNWIYRQDPFVIALRS